MKRTSLALAPCWVHEGGEWWPAEALEFADDEAHVRFLGFPWRANRWLPMPYSMPYSSSRDIEGEAGLLRLSFYEPRRCRAASRQPSHEGPTCVGATATDSADNRRVDDVGTGTEVIILRSGKHERQHGVVEESRCGYHLVRTQRGEQVHVRARDLVPVSGVCDDSDELDEEDFATYLPAASEMLLDGLDAAESGGGASNDGALYGPQSPARDTIRGLAARCKPTTQPRTRPLAGIAVGHLVQASKPGKPGAPPLRGVVLRTHNGCGTTYPAPSFFFVCCSLQLFGRRTGAALDLPTHPARLFLDFITLTLQQLSTVRNAYVQERRAARRPADVLSLLLSPTTNSHPS